MRTRLFCKISKGQFSGEVAVQGKLYNSEDFSLFAPIECVEFDSELNEDSYVDGSISVDVLDNKDDLVLVSLPQPAFENGQTITVKKEQLSSY